ncbi:hypothetical protein HZS_3222 [Henneguya salminicola]|nr:hypothetical protein HZS_3222 [Henneguya salminicola]
MAQIYMAICMENFIDFDESLKKLLNLKHRICMIYEDYIYWDIIFACKFKKIIIGIEELFDYFSSAEIRNMHLYHQNIFPKPWNN